MKILKGLLVGALLVGLVFGGFIGCESDTQRSMRESVEEAQKASKELDQIQKNLMI
ncbi:MAG TPA: hypothetical protein PKV16_06145 [Caldisericia bacterium]|nr:hypothetical protein [Caldisericia bacterium]HPF49230.1 hypothetical protein [Caldisericia bacterium]HPI84090.1 hypothetical protein [Caldisericia bacterium]HPQ93348.1 hypothetical protein [Caldisericia bacterium]HRV75270.1 hypothetical protein [Caldisericia bacterium]